MTPPLKMLKRTVDKLYTLFQDKPYGGGVLHTGAGQTYPAAQYATAAVRF